MTEQEAVLRDPAVQSVCRAMCKEVARTCARLIANGEPKRMVSAEKRRFAATMRPVLARVSLALCLLFCSGCIFGGGGRNTVDTVLFVEPGAYARIATDKPILITATDATGKEHFEKKNLAGMAVEPESVHKKYLEYWEQGHPK